MSPTAASLQRRVLVTGLPVEGHEKWEMQSVENSREQGPLTMTTPSSLPLHALHASSSGSPINRPANMAINEGGDDSLCLLPHQRAARGKLSVTDPADLLYRFIFLLVK